ncbi:MAG: hypothetical protein U1F56_20900 [Rubrivivax sp.]
MRSICNRRGALIRLLGPVLAPAGARAVPQPEWLVSPEEARALAAAPGAPLWTTRVAGAPVIEVLRPLLDAAAAGPLTSPLPIELQFRAAADAAIDPKSFRIFYGAFQLDVTQRLLKAVAVRPEGLRVEQAAIPAGSHRLVVQIADTLERVGMRELRFSVR